MFLNRIKQCQSTLAQNKCDAFLVTDPINLFYLTGLNLSKGWLLILPGKARLFVDGRYYEQAKIMSPIPVALAKNSKEIILELSQNKKVAHLGFESESTSYSQYELLKKMCQKVKLRLIPISHCIKKIRTIKDKVEIAHLQKAAQLGTQGFEFVCSQLKQGITEKKLAIELEIFWKNMGADAVAFDPIIAFGKNSAYPHYRPANVKLKKNDIVLIDIGVTLNHYHSDMTRTIFFGKPNPQLQSIHAVASKAQKEAVKLIKPGVPIQDLDACARSIIDQAGFGSYFTHSLGHGIGLEVHELPFLSPNLLTKRDRLEEGMVLTIEPGIYLPGLGGVRIEDTIVITNSGFINITNDKTTLNEKCPADVNHPPD